MPCIGVLDQLYNQFQQIRKTINIFSTVCEKWALDYLELTTWFKTVACTCFLLHGVLSTNLASQEPEKHLNFFNVSSFCKFHKVPICKSVFFRLEIDWTPYLRILKDIEKTYWSDIYHALNSPKNKGSSKIEARFRQDYSSVYE